MTDKGEQDNRGFKIVDRRRFDADGNTRADVPDTVRAPDPPPAPAAAKAAPPPGPAAKGPAPAKAAPPPPAREPLPPEEELPEPPEGSAGTLDFMAFIQSLGQQALMQLGLVPYPDTGLVEQSLPLARQTIDILSLLHQKTRGNLNPKEERFMEALTYDLRMAYVKVTEAQMKQAIPPELRKGGPAARR